MYSKVLSCCIHGINGQMIEVEVDLSNGLPQFNIVGLPDSAIRESIERVRAAIKNCGFEFPMKRITVNLAPANIRKEGASFDLAIAIGILIASKQLHIDDLEQTLIIGELSLDGTLRSIPGVLSMIMDAQKDGIKSVILPSANAQEADLISDIKIKSISHLSELMFNNHKLINNINSSLCKLPAPNSDVTSSNDLKIYNEDYDDVRGQYHAKRSLMVAAAGMHNILLIGPPGSGKTMLMRRLPSILPPLSNDESLEVTKIYSVSKQLSDRAHLIQQRPFRSPHHSISQGGLIGGGSIPMPGEVSMAHRGVLFLDEFPEFSRHVLEVLRQPLEDKQVTLARARAVYTFPCDFILAASMNPCPCGYNGSETKVNVCICSPIRINQYRSKISGPLLDRIDLHVDVPRIDYKTFTSNEDNLSSSDMKQLIHISQLIQLERYKGSGVRFNSQISGKLLHKYCKLNKEAQDLLVHAFDAIGLSARAHDRILKIARTLADLEASLIIEPNHIAEAIQYRSLDRKYL